MKILTSALLALAIPSFVVAAAPTDRLFYTNGSKISLTARTESGINAALPRIITAFELDVDATQLKFEELKESLYGNHYYYKQVVNGVAVFGSEFVVSTNKRGQVFRIYNNVAKKSTTSTTTPSGTKSTVSSHPLVSNQGALDIAWRELRVNGELLQAPKAELVFTSEMKLVYNVDISTSSPFGHWAVTVDATNGKVLEVKDGALPRMKRAEGVYRTNAPTVSLSSALNAFRSKEAKKSIKLYGATKANGTATVFDPNPTVTLGRTDLQDTTDASVLAPAYKTEDLQDITFAAGVYSLVGPKVTLADFESPNIAPSTTTDGHWDFQRKNVAFNDAMTYYHLDKNMRYIESLGFVGTKVIFPKSVEVDANGVQGQDNSHYIPSSRRLAFGHGCVDDNEDADVILHELGHAIHHHINPRWNGGDTGAMGEGFGDYWAASYSATVPGGLDTKPEWVFKWDGHNNCWDGRKLNATNMKYDPKKSYYAHSRVADGISDELWSTPIFQAFLELYKSGVSRADIDKIVLEAHFGLGSGVKMPEMAQSIVKTAKALFPSKKYDEVYARHFKQVNILQ